VNFSLTHKSHKNSPQIILVIAGERPCSSRLYLILIQHSLKNDDQFRAVEKQGETEGIFAWRVDFVFDQYWYGSEAARILLALGELESQ
jgi:rRNA maturation protein Rpf1